MSTPNPTVRTLARQLGLSRATVANAIAGHGRVAPDTRQRVLAAAKAVGYKSNPLATHFMSSLRRSRVVSFRGTLAALDISKEGISGLDLFIKELVAGAQKRARNLGFTMESIRVAPEHLTTTRLNTILHARGIQGLLLLPSPENPDLRDLDWSRYAAVYTDRNASQPALDTVCSDHYNSMLALLDILKTRGYARPGLILEDWKDLRLQRRRTAALHTFAHNNPRTKPVPPLLRDILTKAEFQTWFREHQPDVVIGHRTETIDWMESCGARVPATHGFATLNQIYRKCACAGLDLQPQEIGARSADQLIAQLHRNEMGTPAWPTSTTILARWIDGPTIRQA